MATLLFVVASLWPYFFLLFATVLVMNWSFIALRVSDNANGKNQCRKHLRCFLPIRRCGSAPGRRLAIGFSLIICGKGANERAGRIPAELYGRILEEFPQSAPTSLSPEPTLFATSSATRSFFQRV